MVTIKFATISKKSLCFFLLILTTFCLFACGRKERKMDMPKDTIYHEWLEEIKLFSDETLKVMDYEEKDGSVLIVLGYLAEFKKDEMYVSGYKAVLSLISRHNTFVKNNPGYFADSVNITLWVQARSESTEMVFTTGSGYEGLDDKNDKSFNCVMFEDNIFPKILMDSDITFDFENVVLDTTYSLNDVLDVKEDYYPLSVCRNYKNIIVKGHYDSSDYTIIPTMIEPYDKSSNIYYYASSNGKIIKIR